MELKKYRLKEIATIWNGATPSSAHPEYYDGDIVWLTPKDLSDQKSKYIFNGERMISKEGFNSCSTHLLPKGTILMSSRAPIGLLAISGCECCTNQGFKNIIVDSKQCDAEFLFYYLKFNMKRIVGLGSGTTFLEVSKASLENFEIELPSLSRQQRIAHVLSSIDQKIALNRDINRNLEAMLDTITDYYLSSSSILKECIRNLGTIKAGGDCPTIFKNEVSEEFKIPIYSNGINNEGLYGYTTNESKIVPSRTLTIAARGTIGASFIRMTPYVPIIRLISIIPYDKGGDIWIHQMVNRMTFEKNGSVQQQLTVPEISNFNIPYPSSTEILKYESQTTPILQIIHSNKTEINKLQNLRDTLLPLLMNGQVSVMPQEVNCDLSHD